MIPIINIYLKKALDGRRLSMAHRIESQDGTTPFEQYDYIGVFDRRGLDRCSHI